MLVCIKWRVVISVLKGNLGLRLVTDDDLIVHAICYYGSCVGSGLEFVLCILLGFSR